MKVQVLSLDNQQIGQISVDLHLFGCEERIDILHNVVQWQMAARRAGTHSVKERGDVKGSTRKIYRQKGTGGARHGGIRGAQFRGGGIIFGPVVRDHAYKINKKVRKLALRVALSLKMREKSIIVLDELRLNNPNTNDLHGKLKGLGLKSALFVDSKIDENFKLSISNLQKMNVLPDEAINVLDILRHDKVVLTVNALQKIEARLV